MKTTKIALLVFFTAWFSINLQAQKTVLNTGEVPKQITTYVEQNFPEHHILKAHRDVDNGKTEYEVKLNNHVELEFDNDFQIKEIDSKNGFPQKLLPTPIAEYLEANYPHATVTEWKRTKNGQKIELNNKVDFEFDQNGKFLQMD